MPGCLPHRGIGISRTVRAKWRIPTLSLGNESEGQRCGAVPSVYLWIMRSLVLVLLVAGCNWTEGLACGWTDHGVQRLDPLPQGQCWEMTPPDGMSITAVGAGSCDADQGTTTQVWCPGIDVEAFTSSESTGKLKVAIRAVDCPASCE